MARFWPLSKFTLVDFINGTQRLGCLLRNRYLIESLNECLTTLGGSLVLNAATSLLLLLDARRLLKAIKVFVD